MELSCYPLRNVDKPKHQSSNRLQRVGATTNLILDQVCCKRLHQLMLKALMLPKIGQTSAGSPVGQVADLMHREWACTSRHICKRHYIMHVCCTRV